MTDLALNLTMPSLTIQHNPIRILPENLMPVMEPVVYLQLFSSRSKAFSPSFDHRMSAPLDADLKVFVIIDKLMGGVSPTALDLSTALIPLSDYQAFIAKYTTAQLDDVQKRLAEQIMAPALSQTHRQAELRCVLALVYLQQDRADRARAQLKSAEKTEGFTLPSEFADLYKQLKHPTRAHGLRG